MLPSHSLHSMLQNLSLHDEFVDLHSISLQQKMDCHISCEKCSLWIIKDTALVLSGALHCCIVSS